PVRRLYVAAGRCDRHRLAWRPAVAVGREAREAGRESHRRGPAPHAPRRRLRGRDRRARRAVQSGDRGSDAVALEHEPEKACPGHLIRGGYRFSEKIMLHQLAHSPLMPAARMTFVHFSVSPAMNLAKSPGDPPKIRQPRSARRCFVRGSARPALISLLSLSTISAGVSLGAAMPYQPLAS